MKWRCPQCERSAEQDWKYCPNCGVTILETCHECGEQEPVGRPACLVRVSTVKEEAIKYAETYTMKQMNKSAVFRTRAHTLGDGIPMIIFISLALSSVPGTAILIGSIGVKEMALAMTLGWLLYTVVTVSFIVWVCSDDNHDYYRKLGIKEYYRIHPEDGVMIQLVQANPGMVEFFVFKKKVELF